MGLLTMRREQKVNLSGVLQEGKAVLVDLGDDPLHLGQVLLDARRRLVHARQGADDHLHLLERRHLNGVHGARHRDHLRQRRQAHPGHAILPVNVDVNGVPDPFGQGFALVRRAVDGGWRQGHALHFRARWQRVFSP